MMMMMMIVIQNIGQVVTLFETCFLHAGLKVLLSVIASGKYRNGTL